ncbi:carboxypeptidase regulatory-like domain-containing protein, partial [Thauera chlorobenzoica]
PAGNDDEVLNIRIDATTGGDPPTDIYLPYVGTMVTLSGNVTTTSGGPADEVVVRVWASRKLETRVYPAANGDWSAEVPPGTYDVTYLRAGCEPVCHGPYTVELPPAP